MHNFRAFGLILLILISAFSAVQAKTPDTKGNNSALEANKPQQLVEEVDIQGNRRLRDEDLLYYIKTRPGDTFDPKQLERDLKELLSLNFFDKTATKVLTEEAPRGGVKVIFEVKELPIIRDLQFQGAKAIQESDILKAFREQRVGISKEAVYNPVNAQKANRVLREMLASKGFPNAKVEIKEEEVSATSIGLTFVIDQGKRSRIVQIEFEGNEVFKDGELRGALELVKKSGLISRFKSQDVLDLRKLQYDLQVNVRQYMASKGYLQARIGDPKIEGLGVKRTGFIPLLPLPLLSSKDDTLRIVVPVTEGKVFRVGDVKIEGNSIFSEEQIMGGLGLKKGDIANGKRLRDALYEDLKKVYGSSGFVQYDAEYEPDFKDNPANPKEGIADFKITIDEGKQFRLRRLEFTGNTFTRDRVLRREMLINEGDIYNQRGLEISVARLNQTQYFDPIDKDKDVEIRTDEEQGDVDLILKVKEKGRQQIQFNGGVSGIGGSFFGLEYSTNNLLGRGETVSINLGVGNRQRNFQVSFTEPYFRNRPITVGGSVFLSTYQFFGDGTFLSQNPDAIIGAINPFGTVSANSENLFTQSTYGVSVFATAPLSEVFFKKRRWSTFSRVGLTYQYSASTIKDPPVNKQNDPTKFIPVVFAQPNITTSQVTGSFVYDTKQPAENGIDTLRGTQISAAIAFAGLGGDVRTYQPTLSYTQFLPIRRKRSKNPEVFGFRLQAGHIGAFSATDKIRNSNSLAFINSVPFYSRYFMGSEYDIRGYNTRSLGPIAAIDGFLTTKNLFIAESPNAVSPTAFTGLSAADQAALIDLGTFSGVSGTNSRQTSRNYRNIGGDTQLLGNFEYRVPIFGPVVLAAFADIGSVFNLKKGAAQEINSAFLQDQPFLGTGSINNTVFLTKNHPYLQTDPRLDGIGAFFYDSTNSNKLVTRAAYIATYCSNDETKCPATIPTNLKPIFLRGDAQTNTLVRVNDSVFGKFGDFRSSVGLELRVQVPVVNVPFRLIYYYNPNAKLGFTQELPGLFLPGKKSGLRFTVGRTF